MTDPISHSSDQEEATGCIPALFRLFWMIAGNVVLILFTLFIAQRRTTIIFDVLFWFNVIVLAVIRYIDIKKFKGQTSEGEPATLQHWRQYAIILLLVAGALYASAKIIAHFKLL